jgi:hypothetical protein
MIRKRLVWKTGMGLEIISLGVHGKYKTFKMKREGRG